VPVYDAAFVNSIVPLFVNVPELATWDEEVLTPTSPLLVMVPLLERIPVAVVVLIVNVPLTSIIKVPLLKWVSREVNVSVLIAFTVSVPALLKVFLVDAWVVLASVNPANDPKVNDEPDCIQISSPPVEATAPVIPTVRIRVLVVPVNITTALFLRIICPAEALRARFALMVPGPPVPIFAPSK